MEIDSTIDLRNDFCRLARFGANITDAHSCFIFLPPHLLEHKSGEGQHWQTDCVALAGYHSLSSDVLDHARIEVGTGILGWVSQNKKPVHVAPFEQDSRTLGAYRSDQQLKSLIAVPIALDFMSDGFSREVSGVLACDSKKSYAFSKLQGKLLTDLSFEISNILRLNLLNAGRENDKLSWNEFIRNGQNLIAEIHKQSVDILRVHLENFDELELRLGTKAAATTINRLYHLIRQSLPTNFPTYQLPNGDLILVLDNMMSVFYQNKIDSLAKHIANGDFEILLSYVRQSFSSKQNRNKDLEELLIETNSYFREVVSANPKRSYVFGRA